MQKKSSFNLDFHYLFLENILGYNAFLEFLQFQYCKLSNLFVPLGCFAFDKNDCFSA